MSEVWNYTKPKLKDGTKEKRIVEIIFNEVEEKAVQSYADKHKITYGEALQQIIDAMTKGLIDLATEDDEFESIRKTQTKIETLDNSLTDSDSN
jgi:hypothetical protein